MRPQLATLLLLLMAATSGSAQQSLSKVERRVRDAAAAGIEDQIRYLQRVVDMPSSTLDLEGVRAVGAEFARSLDSLGFETRWAEMPPEMRRAGHLIAEHRGRKGRRPAPADRPPGHRGGPRRADVQAGRFDRGGCRLRRHEGGRRAGAVRAQGARRRGRPARSQPDDRLHRRRGARRQPAGDLPARPDRSRAPQRRGARLRGRPAERSDGGPARGGELAGHHDRRRGALGRSLSRGHGVRRHLRAGADPRRVPAGAERHPVSHVQRGGRARGHRRGLRQRGHQRDARRAS